MLFLDWRGKKENDARRTERGIKGERMPKTNDNIIKFLRENMRKTVRLPKDSGGLLNYPYTVPSTGDGFRNFFYWDTYFANWALYAMGMYEQAGNNLKNMAELINKFGYMPNADVLTNRSQPPLFIRGVYEYREQTGDAEFVRKMLPAMRAEYDFWMRDRIAPCGLNRYGSSAKTEDEIISFNKEIAERLGLNLSEKEERDVQLLASAESGWDFTSRFFDNGESCRSYDICPVDLNAILFDAELKLAQFEREFGSGAERMEAAAAKRKELMRKYMYDGKTYRDCYADTGELRGENTHAGSFFAAAFGVDKNCGVKTLCNELMTKHGLLTCTENKYSKRFQWDYPMMWPPLAGIAEVSLRKAGEYDLAEELRVAFIRTVEKVFECTGNLWEKYNVVSCVVGHAAEYKTPPMLGWTAGVYLRFTEIQNKKGEKK